MGEVRFMISEAAKQVKVESHVLRYWEEELNLEIGRTEMGHRYYTKDDIQLFRCIKKLKDEGMLLKDLKPLIPELKQTRLKLQGSTIPDLKAVKEREGNKAGANFTSIKTSAAPSGPLQNQDPSPTLQPSVSDISKASSTADAPSPTKKAESTSKLPSAADKPSELSVTEADVVPITQLEQVRSLIGDVLTEVVATNNETLKKDITKAVTKDVIREMDFLFQAKERQEEEHFRKLDCLIRQQQANRREAAKENPIGKLKKLLT